jgi:propanol-preferring alcohol dehydrogenase
MSLQQIGSLDENPEPLQLVDIPKPVAADDEILIRVAACGVCHTELDEIEGRTPPPQLPVIPGHEVVGYVEEVGNAAGKYKAGDRVGVGWIFRSSTRSRKCSRTRRRHRSCARAASATGH